MMKQWLMQSSVKCEGVANKLTLHKITIVVNRCNCCHRCHLMKRKAANSCPHLHCALIPHQSTQIGGPCLCVLSSEVQRAWARCVI